MVDLPLPLSPTMREHALLRQLERDLAHGTDDATLAKAQEAAGAPIVDGERGDLEKHGRAVQVRAICGLCGRMEGPRCE